MFSLNVEIRLPGCPNSFYSLLPKYLFKKQNGWEISIQHVVELSSVLQISGVCTHTLTALLQKTFFSKRNDVCQCALFSLNSMF